MMNSIKAHNQGVEVYRILSLFGYLHCFSFFSCHVSFFSLCAFSACIHFFLFYLLHPLTYFSIYTTTLSHPSPPPLSSSSSILSSLPAQSKLNWNNLTLCKIIQVHCPNEYNIQTNSISLYIQTCFVSFIVFSLFALLICKLKNPKP